MNIRVLEKREVTISFPLLSNVGDNQKRHRHGSTDTVDIDIINIASKGQKENAVSIDSSTNW